MEGVEGVGGWGTGNGGAGGLFAGGGFFGGNGGVMRRGGLADGVDYSRSDRAKTPLWKAPEI